MNFKIKLVALMTGLAALVSPAGATYIQWSSVSSIGPSPVYDSGGIFGPVGSFLPANAIVTEEITFDLELIRKSPDDTIGYSDRGWYSIAIGNLAFTEPFTDDNYNVQFRLVKDFVPFINGTLRPTVDELISSIQMQGNVSLFLTSFAFGPPGSISPAMDFSDDYTFAQAGNVQRDLCNAQHICTQLDTNEAMEFLDPTEPIGGSRGLGTIPVVITSAVPEPASWALLGMGLLAVMTRKRLGKIRY